MALDYLQTLGRAREQIKEVAKTPVGEVLKNFAQDSINLMKEKVPKATGTLSQSLIVNFSQEDGIVDVNFLADDYWDYINSGVVGTETDPGVITNQFGSTYSFAQVAKVQSSQGLNFKESISLWMISKGIQADDMDSLAFAIMQSVKRKGKKASKFVTDTFTEESIKQLESDIADAFLKIL